MRRNVAPVKSSKRNWRAQTETRRGHGMGRLGDPVSGESSIPSGVNEFCVCAPRPLSSHSPLLMYNSLSGFRNMTPEATFSSLLLVVVERLYCMKLLCTLH